MDSVLTQERVNFEFIIVNDGSRDGTAKLLSRYPSADSRVKVLSQENRGLTESLIRGCSLARGDFIVRHDAGDVSVAGRLEKQLKRLIEEPGAVMCSSFAEFRGPRDEYLYTVSIDESALPSGGAGEMKGGPSHHGTVMMRRDAYRAAGGYRRAFYFAQDIDLWSRLTELGSHVLVSEVLYTARIESSSLSGRYADEQRRLTNLVRQAADARSAGQDEASVLKAAQDIQPRGSGEDRKGIAAGAYFIGSCLQSRDPLAARGYFREAVANNPSHWRAWLKFAGFSGAEPTEYLKNS